MDKEQTLWLLYKDGILARLHKELLKGLVGTMEKEYLSLFPTTFVPLIQLPIFSSVINSLVANLIHHYAKDMIEIIVDIIQKNEFKMKTKKENKNAN